jgi:hypothetical protein
MSDILAWAICAAAGGAGPGKCDLDHCVCGAEARQLHAVLAERGYAIVKTDIDPGSPTDISLQPTFRRNVTDYPTSPALSGKGES